MAHKKGLGSSRNGRDSNAQRLGVKTFAGEVVTGGEIVNEFLMSAGYLPGAHDESCPVYKKVLKAKPTWNER